MKFREIGRPGSQALCKRKLKEFLLHRLELAQQTKGLSP